ncbi:eukaryotic translation initiation factor 4 gamma 1-like [Alligator mississippiensis]|uniref:Eukaryotic translation initiation factor 4 gamma 1-like n=1 Tax=Alligator mississippiensis TaxID=8496 RepID=A0A151PHC1_ALLMI|nr:eukaryotic translation initiation factor 4 gamma 1-like [Alligator mississippiensis]
MNKAPQPTGGAPTAPHPAPSPGLPQSAFPPGQTAPVVFNPSPASQMNTPSQPRQGGFRSLQPRELWEGPGAASVESGPPWSQMLGPDPPGACLDW